jgi:hypothetical protein
LYNLIIGRGKNNNSIEQQKINDFLKGKSNHLSFTPKSSRKLGFSPAQKTASGSGTHGGSAKQNNKRDRQQTKRELRDNY